MESIDPTGRDGERVATPPVVGDDAHLTVAYLDSILEHSGEMIFLLNEKGVVLSFSRGGERLLGYSREEVVHHSVQEIVHDVAAFERGLQSCRERGHVVIPAFRFRNREVGRTSCDLSLIRIPVGGQSGEIVLGIGRDQSAAESLREDLVRVDRLAELGRAASGIAHDINNPVAVIGEISGWIEVLISDAGGLSSEEREELVKAIKDIKKQTQRCKSITHQVLNFARDSRSEKRSFDLHKVLTNTVLFLRSETISKNIEVVLDLMEDPPPLRSDPERLEQVFINLLSNAIYAIKEKDGSGGKIRLRTSKRDHMVEVVVSDNGAGIPEDMAERVFDLFYTTKPSGKGTGLGLPICRNIIEKLGGEITFESDPGVGTSFYVRLPMS
jgi:PAS domain S-box-containing protein